MTTKPAAPIRSPEPETPPEFRVENKVARAMLEGIVEALDPSRRIPADRWTDIRLGDPVEVIAATGERICGTLIHWIPTEDDPQDRGYVKLRTPYETVVLRETRSIRRLGSRIGR